MFSQNQFNSWVDTGQRIHGMNAQAALLGAAAQGQHGDAAIMGAQTAASRAPSQNAADLGHAAYLQAQKDLDDAQRQSEYGFANGTSQVPGNADPRVDSVPAELAPQEAVLNAGAADMVGRGLIDVLNAMGALKMGMPPAQPQVAQGMPDAKPGYAKGTSNVMPKGGASKKGDNGAGAAALMTFLQGMGGGGGGRPAPMGGQPMGLPMPSPR